MENFMPTFVTLCLVWCVVRVEAMIQGRVLRNVGSSKLLSLVQWSRDMLLLVMKIVQMILNERTTASLWLAKYSTDLIDTQGEL